LVESCLELYREAAMKSQERSMMNVRGEIIPYLNLRDLFVIGGERLEIEQVVVAATGGDKMCFGVDHVVGQLQTVIKGLGRAYKDAKGISGATILGDGTVALILDIAQLVEAAKDGHGQRSPHQAH
jgi:two-component system chemotaxis sensor kinase CheA